MRREVTAHLMRGTLNSRVPSNIVETLQKDNVHVPAISVEGRTLRCVSSSCAEEDIARFSAALRMRGLPGEIEELRTISIVMRQDPTPALRGAAELLAYHPASLQTVREPVTVLLIGPGQVVIDNEGSMVAVRYPTRGSAELALDACTSLAMRLCPS